MPKKTEAKADLKFSYGSTPEGFTSAGVQGFNELNPAAIVREFIQNSLDAVREDNRSCTIVRFEIEEIKLAKVPAIDSYRIAFQKAVKDQTKFQNGELSDQAAMVVDAISSCLGEKKVEVLSVLDNGLGLNEKRMTGLLSDGMSMKSSAGSGAVGNGHLTAIPASDLRYVLYGGISSDDKKIASGHAILASFSSSKDGAQLGKDGYYATSINNQMEKPYDFPSGKAVASLIKTKLDWIESHFDSKTGAVVIIPGFNRFREGEGTDLWSVIKKAAACSFFTAIADGHLEIYYKEADKEKSLTKTSLKKFFSGDLASEKRAKNFLSGSRASEAYKTATEGREFTVSVECGKVEIRLRELTSGLSRIDLCRNGMWITDRLPRLNTNKFSDRKPFHCLIKVTSQDGEIHRLIRKSEGPLHNHIEARKWLKPDEQKQLNAACGHISDFLLEQLEVFQDEEFRINDFLTVMSGEGVAGGNRRGGHIGNFEEIEPRRTRTPATDSDGGKETGGKGDGSGGRGKGTEGENSFKRSGNSVPFGAIPVPTGVRSCNVELYPQEDLSSDIEAEIRFILEEGIDESCDLTNEEQFVQLKDVKLNNKKVTNDSLIKSGDSILGIRLGQFKKEEKHILDFTYDLPENVEIQAEDRVVLRAEIVRRKIVS